MKFNKLFIVAAVCGTSLLASCDFQQGADLQRKYSKASLADGDSFQLLKLIGDRAQYEVAYAKYAEQASSSAEVKKVAQEIQAVYASLDANLDSLATSLQLVYPNHGVPAFQADSTVAFDDKAYLAHVQKDVADINLKLAQESKNTNVAVQHFAHEQAAKFAEIYTLAGGKAEAHAHH